MAFSAGHLWGEKQIAEAIVSMRLQSYKSETYLLWVSTNILNLITSLKKTSRHSIVKISIRMLKKKLLQLSASQVLTWVCVTALNAQHDGQRPNITFIDRKLNVGQTEPSKLFNVVMAESWTAELGHRESDFHSEQSKKTCLRIFWNLVTGINHY